MQSLALLLVVTPLVIGLRLQMPDEVYKGPDDHAPASMDLASTSGDTFDRENMDFNQFDDYAGIFSKEQEQRLDALQQEYWQMDKIRDNQGLFKALEGSEAIYFVYTKRWAAVQVRAGEVVGILKTAGFNAKEMACNKFCALEAKDLETAIVVHSKFTCSCDNEEVDAKTVSPTFPTGKVSKKGALRIFDPIDAPQLQNLTDILSLNMGVFSGSNDLTDQFNKIREKSAVTLPHHHSNFQNIRHESSLNGKIRIVQAGDFTNDKITRGLTSCLNAKLDAETLARVDPVAQLLKHVNCTEKTQGPSHRGHCYAQKLAQFDIAIVWVQPGMSMPRKPALIKPPQRLANALSVGIPAVAHSQYSGHHDAAAFGRDAVHLVDDEQQMCDRVVQLVTDRTLYNKAAEQALEVAEKYSPAAIGKQTAEAFKYFKK